jgi:hypothetical protein
MGAASTVVATDTASADADLDNGAVALYGAPRYGRRDDHAGHRVEERGPAEARSLLPPSGGPT